MERSAMPPTPGRTLPKQLGLALLPVALGALTGCSSRPVRPYQAPDLSTPDAFTAPLAEGVEAGEPELAAWWSTF
ncbi:MAG: hypothetical protein KC933_40305, partial [Myxococcales bacterium]|nr:hypothetical protein [Myxococcales bacterium]